jgi:hypothetical protein
MPRWREVRSGGSPSGRGGTPHWYPHSYEWQYYSKDRAALLEDNFEMTPEGGSAIRCLVRCATVGLALAVLAPVFEAPPAWAQVGAGGSELSRPEYQIGSAGRFNEDWSGLRGVDLGATDDVWDRLKFIPLTRDASVWLTLGGQLRERGEYFRHFLFGDSRPEDTDAYLLSRVRLIADLHVTPYLRRRSSMSSTSSTGSRTSCSRSATRRA